MKAAPSITLSKLFGKEPPASVEAEAHLLGCLLISTDRLGEVQELLPESEAFTTARHQAVYDAITRLHADIGRVDVVILADMLDEDEGIVAYLCEIAEKCQTPAHAGYYARIVRARWDLRRLIEALGAGLHDAYTQTDVIGDMAGGIIAKAEERVSAIAGERPNANRPAKIADIATTVANGVIDPDSGPQTPVITTGFNELDQLVIGMQPGDLFVWAARPSMGKTSAMLCAARNIASRQMVPVLIVSLEMRRERLVQRLLAIMSEVPLRAVRSSSVDSRQASDITNASEKLGKLPIWIVDAPEMTVAAIASLARQYQRDHGVQVVMIDYLQKVSPPVSKSGGGGERRRHDEVAAISTALKTTARMLGICIVCMAQVSRGPEQREDKRPRLSDLGESSQLEKDADAVVMIHREWYYRCGDPQWCEENGHQQTAADFIVAKCRDGETGSVPVRWEPTTTAFMDLAARKGEELMF